MLCETCFDTIEPGTKQCADHNDLDLAPTIWHALPLPKDIKLLMFAYIAPRSSFYFKGVASISIDRNRFPGYIEWLNGVIAFNQAAPKVRMPWGKHKGTPIIDVPISYLTWVVQKSQASHDLKEQAKQCMQLKQQ